MVSALRQQEWRTHYISHILMIQAPIADTIQLPPASALWSPNIRMYPDGRVLVINNHITCRMFFLCIRKLLTHWSLSKIQTSDPINLKSLFASRLPCSGHHCCTHPSCNKHSNSFLHLETWLCLCGHLKMLQKAIVCRKISVSFLSIAAFCLHLSWKYAQTCISTSGVFQVKTL